MCAQNNSAYIHFLSHAKDMPSPDHNTKINPLGLITIPLLQVLLTARSVDFKTRI
jgi:hypothetical protein